MHRLNSGIDRWHSTYPVMPSACVHGQAGQNFDSNASTAPCLQPNGLHSFLQNPSASECITLRDFIFPLVERSCSAADASQLHTTLFLCWVWWTKAVAGQYDACCLSTSDTQACSGGAAPPAAFCSRGGLSRVTQSMPLLPTLFHTFLSVPFTRLGSILFATPFTSCSSTFPAHATAIWARN